MPGKKKSDGGKDHKKPDDVKNDSPPMKDDGHTDGPTKDADCSDQQACLISADVQASVLGIDVCADLCVGGDLPLDLGDLDLPIVS